MMYFVPVWITMIIFGFVLLLIRMCLSHAERVEKMKLDYKYGMTGSGERVIDYTNNQPR